MRTLNKLLLTSALIGVFTITGAFAQTKESTEKTVTFKLGPGEDMFYASSGGNNTELDRLYSFVDEYRVEITADRMPAYVGGYCVSFESHGDNLRTAAVCSNQVKSGLIENKSLVEDNFITKNHAAAYGGQTDIVVVMLRIPIKVDPDNARLEQERWEREAAERERQAQVERERIERERSNAERERAEAERATSEQNERDAILSCTEPAAPSKPFCFAVRTNLLYDSFLLPTLGVEWRVRNSVGVKVDGSYGYWSNEHGKVQKIWLVSPEVRWYMGENKRLYFGASVNFGEYNIYRYMIGSFFSGDTGYQGNLWGAGLTVGYQLYLSRSFSLDFNLGLGCANLKYDSFTMSDDTRVYKEKDMSKGFWGLTQAGVSLVWTIARRK